MIRYQFLKRVCFPGLTALLLVMGGCTAPYFHTIEAPPGQPIQHTLAELPIREYWTGLIFNGEKIGFTRFNLSQDSSAAGRYGLTAECVMFFQFLGFSKRIELRSYDQVREDLTLVKFVYDYNLDGNRVHIRGQCENDVLRVEVDSRGEKTEQHYQLDKPLYPASTILLYPVIHGLEKGRRYTYDVYSGETRSIHTVEQHVSAYEESELFQGKAFRVKTRLQGQSVTTWIDHLGRPVLEMSLNGIVIATLENKTRAEEYLFQAAINKSELMIDYSLIESDRLIDNPAEVQLLQVTFSGIPPTFCPPSDERQHCQCEGGRAVCEVAVGGTDLDQQPVDEDIRDTYLAPSVVIPSISRPIMETAAVIAAEEPDQALQVQRLITWIENNIEQQPVDVFTALDVLYGRKAECQGHAILYAAFARALKIPTRVVNGVIFSIHYKGFVYHTWAESIIDNQWVAVDPTFYQLPADATHIKFIEGERLADLIPLIDVIGRLDAQINACKP